MRVITALAAIVGALVCGCDNSQPVVEKPLLAEKVGQDCIVQFRRGDGLGAGGGNPIPPTTTNYNGADIGVRGKLRAVSGGWIAVESAGTEYCIPRESILMIQFSK
jgi:hypothetical protein